VRGLRPSVSGRALEPSPVASRHSNALSYVQLEMRHSSDLSKHHDASSNGNVEKAYSRKR